ncbi:uncharacterized protein MELLADRAFT_64003 [Melampsora larici-populina 98AG31]|uniref:Tet-like 2OG-Fe(II) oxygenase domain-containing protein n=1 Tax=Melampsora larici-populina (strain 98AG31 / pathotype 3-4-7) TaxID=747676 RepID=F4RPT5_MELLP|nr:uncharacterized protein MELLADRAFT_64003 [Melampsora larici-populina 98AG31]EGG05683.1 hypothetical protein MELLADRAFT_64003 [Melampsora larici-populina 98AG31]
MDNKSKPTDARKRRERRNKRGHDEKNDTDTRTPKTPTELARCAKYKRNRHKSIGSGALTNVVQKIHWVDEKYNPVLRLDKRDPPTIEEALELSLPLFEIQQSLIKQLKALSGGNLDHKDTHNPDAFGGNLSFTMDCFSGIPHTNGDTPGGWSQGIWFQAFRETGKMASQADDGFEVKDGEFYWPDFNVIVDLQAVMGLSKFYGAGPTIITVLSHLTNPQDLSPGLEPLFNSAIADEATLIKEPKSSRKRKNDSVVGEDGTVVEEKKKIRFIKSPMYLVKEIGEQSQKFK